LITHSVRRLRRRQNYERSQAKAVMPASLRHFTIRQLLRFLIHYFASTSVPPNCALKSHVIFIVPEFIQSYFKRIRTVSRYNPVRQTVPSDHASINNPTAKNAGVDVTSQNP